MSPAGCPSSARRCPCRTAPARTPARTSRRSSVRSERSSAWMPGPADVLEALERETRRSLSLWRRLTAAQLFVGSFFGLVLLGTALLLLLPGLYTDEQISF